MRKEHAEHNENLCDHLLSLTGYNDWVVTTAFYSSLHFVEHKLFPLDLGGGTKYANFTDYYTSYRKKRSISKHKAKIFLVQTHMGNVAPQYRWLYDTCMSARYKNYKLNDKEAGTARKRLADIKAACC